MKTSKSTSINYSTPDQVIIINDYYQPTASVTTIVVNKTRPRVEKA